MPHHTPRSDSATGTKVSPATAGSAVLLVSFFLPWVSLLGTSVAGFKLREIWSAGPYLWAIPAAAVAAIVAGLSGRQNAVLGQVAGGLPFVFLAIALYQFGGELFKGLAVGGWLTLASALFLVSAAPRMSRAATDAAPGTAQGETGSSHENQ